MQLVEKWYVCCIAVFLVAVFSCIPQVCLALLVTSVAGVMSALTVPNATILVKANAGSKEVSAVDKHHTSN
jgi:hypothetical protein